MGRLVLIKVHLARHPPTQLLRTLEEYRGKRNTTCIIALATTLVERSINNYKEVATVRAINTTAALAITNKPGWALNPAVVTKESDTIRAAQPGDILATSIRTILITPTGTIGINLQIGQNK